MTVIDRRKDFINKSSVSRKKYIDRFKRAITKSIRKDAVSRGLKSFDGKVKVKVKHDDTIDEPEFGFDYDTGKVRRVYAGNRKYSIGDKMYRYNAGGGKGNPSKDPTEYLGEIELSQEEWRNLLFEDMCLPDFIKQSLNKDVVFKRVRAGFVKDGPPPKLDIAKTFFNSLSRRLCLIESGEKEEDVEFIEEIDLRYRHHIKRPLPCKHAVMICVMDVSGSMGDAERYLSKMFFYLLYLFLTGAYEEVELVFIRHTTDASECTETEFFKGNQTGGTEVFPALALVDDLISNRYKGKNYNFYVAQCSDGDCFGDDGVVCANFVENTLLQKLQYFAYVEVGGDKYRDVTLEDYYGPVADRNEKFNVGSAEEPEDVFPILQELFKKR